MAPIQPGRADPLTPFYDARDRCTTRPEPEHLREAEREWHDVRRRMIAAQEELDWETYLLYCLVSDEGLVAPPDAVPPLQLGERAFEIHMARQAAAGRLDTTWFTRHASTPVTEPYLAALRLRDSGLRKRAVCEECWQRQCEEDPWRKLGDSTAQTSPPQSRQAEQPVPDRSLVSMERPTRFRSNVG